MGKTFFASIPSAVALLYVAGQFLAHSISGRMYFSSTFGPEVIVFVIFGALYIFLAIRIDRIKYLRPAILGLAVGLLIFIAAGVKLFFDFEFGHDLSI